MADDKSNVLSVSGNVASDNMNIDKSNVLSVSVNVTGGKSSVLSVAEAGGGAIRRATGAI